MGEIETYVDKGRIRAEIERHIHSDRNGMGGDVDYPCPFCLRGGHPISHLHVNYEKGVALCHGGCEYRTKSLIRLLKDITGSIPEALLRNGDLDLESYARGLLFPEPDKKEAEKPAEVQLPEEYVRFHPRRTPKHRIGQLVLDYLKGRHLTDELIDELEVGYGYGDRARFHGYAIFPVRVNGVLVTFTSRLVIALSSKAKHAFHSRSREAIFGFDLAKRMRARRVAVGEGPFDAMAFHRNAADDDAGVGLLGKVLHREQVRLLDSLPCEELVMCLDDTEHTKTMVFAEMLERETSKKVSYILLEKGSGDPHDNLRRLPRYMRGRHRMNGLVTSVERLLA